MATFDQRGQKVNYQYNAAGNINFGAAQNKSDVATELQKLQDEVANAVKSGAISEEVSVDIESNIKKSTIQAQKSEPDKKAMLSYLNEAKTLLNGITSVTGLVDGLKQAIEVIGRVF